jgi:type I restriction enzyme S subunit
MDIPVDASWLEFVPKGWNLVKLKWTVNSCKNGVWGSEPIGDDAIICLRVADFNRVKLIVNEEDLTFRSIESKDLKGRLLKNGDLLLEKSGGGKKQLVGAVVQYRGICKAVTSNFVARMEPKKNYSSRFLTYIHAYLYSSKVNIRSIKQTTGIQNLDSSSYLNEVVAIPDLDVQKRIASFLDFKTSQIDELIESKVTLLKLLEEKRVVLITQAVTKGLTPDVKMKYSGVDWLGDIPEHWGIRKLKYISDIRFSGVDKKTVEMEDEVLLCNYLDVYRNQFIDESIEFMRATASKNEVKRFSLQKGDVLVTKDSESPNDIAVPALVVEDFDRVLCGYHLALIRPIPGLVLSEYLFRLFQAPNFNKQFASNANGITRYGISTMTFKDAIVPLIPLSEQILIADFIRIETDRIDDFRSEISRAINKLNEYRNSLITSAVTGKVDVSKLKQEHQDEKTH